MLSKIWIVTKIITALLVGSIVGITAFFFVGQIIFPDFYKPYVVLSGSMEPAVGTGSVAITKPSTTYKVGDVITFDLGKDNIVTHRISKIEANQYFTKGDANEEQDAGTITKSQIIGKMILAIPLLGYLIDFGKTPQGFILLVIIPATIIVYEEARSVKVEVARLLKKKRMENNSQSNQPLNTPPAPSQKRGIPKVYALIPILGCLFLIVAATGAYFSDKEVSTQNKMGAASSFSPEPLTQVLGSTVEEPLLDLRINEIFADPNFGNQWVEIYNPNTTSVDLSSWSLIEGANCDEFSGGTIPAGGFAIMSPLTQSQFLTLWGENTATYSASSTHLGNGLEGGSLLELSSTGCDATARVVDSVEIMVSPDNQSYQKQGTLFVFGPPSPGQ